MIVLIKVSAQLPANELAMYASSPRRSSFAPTTSLQQTDTVTEGSTTLSPIKLKTSHVYNIGIVGNCECLGLWNVEKSLLLNPLEYPFWISPPIHINNSTSNSATNFVFRLVKYNISKKEFAYEPICGWPPCVYLKSYCDRGLPLLTGSSVLHITFGISGPPVVTALTAQELSEACNAFVGESYIADDWSLLDIDEMENDDGSSSNRSSSSCDNTVHSSSSSCFTTYYEDGYWMAYLSQLPSEKFPD